MAKVLAAVPLGKATLHGDENIETPIGGIELAHNYFADDASERLFDEMDYQRATQAYIWSTPLVSMTTWRDSQGPSYASPRTPTSSSSSPSRRSGASSRVI